MNITIKHTRQTFLLLSSFLTLSIYSMESRKRVEIDETYASIRADVKNMTDTCERHCSFLRNLLSGGKCIEECMGEYAKQHRLYLVRKYANRCAGHSFSEKWVHKTEYQEKIHDKAETLVAQNLLDETHISECLRKHLLRYDIKDKFLSDSDHINGETKKLRKTENTLLFETKMTCKKWPI